MGLFTNGQKNASNNEYQNNIRPTLKHDGNIHVVMINSFSKWLDQNFGIEDKYTTQIDAILSNMQQDGYEIIDIKFDSLKGQGITGSMEGFHTLITYR